MVTVIVKSPRVLSNEITVKLTSPPWVSICEDGVTFKFVAPVKTVTVPDPFRVNLTLMVVEPPFFPSDSDDKVTIGEHEFGSGSGVGVGVGIGVGVPLGDGFPLGVGCSLGVGEGSGVGDGSVVGLGSGVGVACGSGVGVGVGLVPFMLAPGSEATSPDTFVFRLTSGMSSSWNLSLPTVTSPDPVTSI